MPRDRGGLARHALHQITIAADAEDVVIEEARVIALEAGAQMLRRQRHPDAVAEALAERPGCRLDAGSEAVLGMAGGDAAELAEMFDLLQRQIIAGQIEHRIQ